MEGNKMKEQLKVELEKIKADLFKMSDHLYENPEISEQEYESMKLLVAYLQTHGFETETGIVDTPTAFKAEFKSKKPGPTVAFLAEYDALPGIGHGCGHNIIGTSSVGAGVILSKMIDEIGGSVIVLGTPAEETNGAKVTMSERGIFDNVDIAMMIHPADQTYASGTSSAMESLQFIYKGKSSHAAETPELGINALDGVIQLFNGINALREHTTADTRIHGIISEGGEAPNVVPDRAVAKFYIRSLEKDNLVKVVQQVKEIGKGAALITGTEVDISHFELGFDNMVTNEKMSQIFNQNLSAVSKRDIQPATHSFGSMDMGNVSKVAPSIHPFIGLNEPGLEYHTIEFANKTITEDGHRVILDSALSLAGTAYDIVTDEETLQAIQEEFEASLPK